MTALSTSVLAALRALAKGPMTPDYFAKGGTLYRGQGGTAHAREMRSIVDLAHRNPQTGAISITPAGRERLAREDEQTMGDGRG